MKKIFCLFAVAGLSVTQQINAACQVPIASGQATDCEPVKILGFDYMKKSEYPSDGSCVPSSTTIDCKLNNNTTGIKTVTIHKLPSCNTDQIGSSLVDNSYSYKESSSISCNQP
jgi:hypothetical protein